MAEDSGNSYAHIVGVPPHDDDDDTDHATNNVCSNSPHRELLARLTTRAKNYGGGKSKGSIGADFHRAMVATDPGEKLLIGRRPVKNWTRRT